MILETIQAEKDEFENEDIQIVEGFSFNQKSTLEQIYRYYNSKYISGDIDDEGNKKYFFNINRNPCKVTTKAIDFDTKHINIQTASGGDPLRTWYFERDLKFWMKDKNFGKVLNRIFAELPVFGSVVLKVINNEPHFADLRNFIIEQSADTLNKANYITERHNFTPMEFRKIGKELGWDSIEEAINEWREMDVQYLTVYERYGEVEENGQYPYKRVYVADVGKDQVDEHTGDVTPRAGIILKQDEVDTHPYWEFHMEKIPGRWLGVGVVEILFDTQIRQNENENLQSKGSYWAALHIFQTRDEAVNRNLATDVKNGEVLTPDDPITQVEIAERNLAFFNQVTDKWLKNRDEQVFSYEVISGERLPAGTPLGSARIAAAMAGSYFDQVRENIALDVKEFLYKVIIPNFQKENSGEHVLRLAGNDLDKMNNLIITQKATDALFRFLTRKLKFPTLVQYDAIKVAISERVKQGLEKLVSIPKEFYKNLKYKIDIIITGEQKDAAVYAATLFAALQAITADPTLLSDPTKRKVFGQWLEQGGVNISDLQPEAKPPSIEQLAERAPTPKGAGGGVSRPAFAPAPAMGPVETRV